MLEKEVTELVWLEFLNATTKWGNKFNSPHEGYAVLHEEIEEAGDEIDRIIENLKFAWKGIRENNETVVYKRVGTIKRHAVLLACEALQIAAVSEKIEDGYLFNEKE